ncbi:hypothetical protein LguiB_010691 [Lonicera macranthoides]
MATPFLLEPKIKFNPLLNTLPPTKIPIKPLKFSFIRTRNNKFNTASKLSVKCFFMNQTSQTPILESTKKQTNLNPYANLNTNTFRDLAKTMLNTLKALRKPLITGILLGLILFHDPNSALAASGGRMGGTAYSSSSSSSRSYRVTRTESPGFSVPYYGPSPFGGAAGVYVGPAVGVGSSFFFVMMGFAAFFLVSGFLSDRSGEGVLTATEKISVLKLQVGLLGMARTLQKDLNRIAETADTSSPEGLSYVLTETTLALLRHPDYCISGYSSVDVKKSIDEGEKRFNQLSIEERGKFDEETLVNVNSVRLLSPNRQRSNGFSNEYIVITILVAAEGGHKLPTINSSGDLKEALQKLGSIPSRRIQAVEVLWTPQNENDSLSERELLQDYSLLRPL